MSFSQADICNQALGNIGVNRLITDMDSDESSDAQACRTHYQIAIETTLRATRWRFAQRFVALAIVEEDPSVSWSFAYRLPVDCLRAYTINESQQFPLGESYELGGDASGGLIYSNAVDAILRFTTSDLTVGLFTSDFVEVAAWDLARRLAQPLSATEGYRVAADTGHRRALARARKNNGGENIPPAANQCEFLAARSSASPLLPTATAGPPP